MIRVTIIPPNRSHQSLAVRRWIEWITVDDKPSIFPIDISFLWTFLRVEPWNWRLLSDKRACSSKPSTRVWVESSCWE